MISGPRSNGARSSALRCRRRAAASSAVRRSLGVGQRAAAAARGGPSARRRARRRRRGRRRSAARPPRRRWPRGRRGPPAGTSAARRRRGSGPGRRRCARRGRPGMRVRSSAPSGPTRVLGGAALAGDAGRDLGADLVPDALRAGRGERLQLHGGLAEDGGHRRRPCSASWSTSRRSSMPGTPAQPQGPRGRAGPRRPSTSERSNGPAARLGAVATVSSVAPASSRRRRRRGLAQLGRVASASAVVATSSGGDDAGRTRRRRLGRLAAFLLVRRKMLTGLVSPSVGRAVRGQRAAGAPNPPLAPCPVSPRWLPGSDSTSRKSAAAHFLDHELGDPVAAAHGERLGGSRLTRLTRISPAVAGVDRARRVQRW